MKDLAYIFDLDGTLANIEHRLHHINGNTKNWDAFNDDCKNDSVNEDVACCVRALNMDYTIIILSGRMNHRTVMHDTHYWLGYHDIPCDYLYLRADADYRSDHVIKREMYEKFVKPNFEVVAAFDDRDQVVRMWRELGEFRCFQVQHGDY